MGTKQTQGGAALCPGLDYCRTFGAKCKCAIPFLARRAQTIAYSLIAILLGICPVHAGLDAESKTPYHLQIVLRVGGDRLFTPLFQEQLRRDLTNHLKLTFGPLAHIEVKQTHELLRDIEARGLEQALERYDKLSGQTTHFVLLDYAAGSYRIQTRFFDGRTAQAGPLTRHAQTNERGAVAQAVAQLVEASFCPVGTVTAVGKEVTLKLQGGELGVPLDRWVQRGHVFSVSRISQQGGRERAQRLEWSALEVLDLPQPGVCRCRYWHRYQEDALREGPGTLGYRALRLPTISGPVKVQLLDDSTLQPLDGVRIHVLKPGAGKPVELLTNRDGVAMTRDSFENLALVQVLSGAAVRAQFPVELYGGRIVVARVKIQADAESLASLEVRRDAWLRRAYDDVRLASERTHELALLLNQSLDAALQSGRKGLPLLDDEILYLDREREELQQLSVEKKAKFNPREGDQQIDDLRKQAKDLRAFVQRLEAVLKDAGDEKALGLVKLVERARLLESEAEFDPAIRLYEQVVQASPEQSAKVRDHLGKLKLAWTPRSDRHAAERKFVYQEWPKIDVADLPKNLVRAQEALATCKDNGDRLTVQKLLRVNIVHMTNLKKELDTLKRLQGEDNRNRRKVLVQAGEALLAVQNEATAFLDVLKK